jgi:hypothetical protein
MLVGRYYLKGPSTRVRIRVRFPVRFLTQFACKPDRVSIFYLIPITWSKDFNLDYMHIDYVYMVDSLPRDSLSEGRGRRLEQGLQPRLHTCTATTTTWSTASRAFPCLRAAGGDWSKDFNYKHSDYDYMVDSLPRDSLSEGCGRRLEQGLQPRLQTQRLRLHGRLPHARFPV